ncbi:MerR family transcriptional regulator [Sulfitobacter aestuarii]|uniref:MerR family transcriptional regulator n=1 Tax=Sulfitobacter aestuarii TaxID=2161676 RepID=A0ABW5TZL2_9RHOB
MSKSRDAFRTISEVADWLGIQAHVLRFWESKFTQVKPIKRAGGRRYYRPADMLLLGGIKRLLHEDGLTIKGVQKILREEGMSHVAALSPPLDETTAPEYAAAQAGIETTQTPEEKGVVLSFDPATRPEPAAPPRDAAQPDPTAGGSSDTSGNEPSADQPQSTRDRAEEPVSAAAPRAEAADLPGFLREPLHTAMTSEDNLPPAEPTVAEPSPETLAKSPASQSEATELPVAAADAAASAKTPRQIALPALTPEADIPVAPGVLSLAQKLDRLDAASAAEVAPLLTRLSALRDRMASQRIPGDAPARAN